MVSNVCLQLSLLPGTHHLLRLLWLIRLLWIRAQLLQMCLWRMWQLVAYGQVGEVAYSQVGECVIGGEVAYSLPT